MNGKCKTIVIARKKAKLPFRQIFQKTMIEEVNEVVIKAVIVGDHGVGKTSIVTRYDSDTFIPGCKPTIGAACINKKFKRENTEYSLSMWDTAGQEVYRNLVPMYFRNTQIAIIVIDVTEKKSLESLDYWINCVSDNCGSDVTVAIVANKIDMTNDRKITTDDIQKVSEQYKIPFFETSALTGVGISKLFEFSLSEFFKKERAVAKPQNIQAKKESNCGC